MPADLYDVLGSSTDASAEEIKQAYRERVREYHPDVNDHPEGDQQFKLIRTAHDVLGDPAERKDYDRLGHREYVEKQYDDLPPVSVFPDEDLPEGTTTGDSPSDDDSGRTPSTTSSTGSARSGSSTGSASSGSSGTSRSSASKSSGSGSSSSSSTSSSASSSSGTSTSGRRSTTASTGSAASTSDSASESTTTESDSSSGGSSGTTAGATRDSWDAATDSSRTTSDASTSAGARRRRGLKRWYGVVAAALLTYLAGLGLYGYARLDALRTTADDLLGSPVTTLLGPFPAGSPTEYVLSAVRAATAGTPESGLVLLAGAALLPLVVLTAVGRFGRGAAWLYALPSLGPAAVLGLWTAMTVPTALALVGLVLLPLLSGGGFLVDVGRYLRATR